MESPNLNESDTFFEFLENSTGIENDAAEFVSQLDDFFSPSIPSVDSVNEIIKLKQEIKDLRKRYIDQESLTAKKELELSQKMSEYFEMKKLVDDWMQSIKTHENEISELKLKIEQLQAENYQYKNLKLETSLDSIKQMKKEINSKTSSVSKLKNQLEAQKRRVSENKKLHDSLMKHSTNLWGYLIDLGQTLSQIGLWSGIQKRILENEYMEQFKILENLKLRDDKDILEVLSEIPVVSVEQWEHNMKSLPKVLSVNSSSSVEQVDSVQKPVVSSSVPSPPLTASSSCVSSPALMELDSSCYPPSNKPDLSKDEHVTSILIGANDSLKGCRDSASDEFPKADMSQKEMPGCEPNSAEFQAGFSATVAPLNKSIPIAVLTENSINICKESKMIFSPESRNHLGASQTLLHSTKNSYQSDIKPDEKSEDGFLEDLLSEEISLEELCQLKYKICLPEDFKCLSPFPPSPSREEVNLDLDENSNLPCTNLELCSANYDIVDVRSSLCEDSNGQDILLKDNNDFNKSVYRCPKDYNPTNINLKNENIHSYADSKSKDDVLNTVMQNEQEQLCGAYNIDSCMDMNVASDNFQFKNIDNEVFSSSPTATVLPPASSTNVLVDIGGEKILNNKNSVKDEYILMGKTELNEATPSSNSKKSETVNSKLSNNDSETEVSNSVSIQTSSEETVIRSKRKLVEETTLSIPARVRGRTPLKPQLKKTFECDSREMAAEKNIAIPEASDVADHSVYERLRKVRKEHKHSNVTEAIRTVKKEVLKSQEGFTNASTDSGNNLNSLVLRRKSIERCESTVINKNTISKNVLCSQSLGVKNRLLDSIQPTGLKMKTNPIKQSKNTLVVKSEPVDFALNNLTPVLSTGPDNSKNFMKNNKVNSQNKGKTIIVVKKEVAKLKKKKKGKKSKDMKLQVPEETPVSLAFNCLRQVRKTGLYSLQAENKLCDVLSNPGYVPDNATLLFYVIQFLLNTRCPVILSYMKTGGTSPLIPVEEAILVSVLLKIEKLNKPHLQKLLVCVVNTLHQVILAKTEIMLYHLSALCRVLTQICLHKQSRLKPLSLCCDLLKSKHKMAPYLIASVAGVWKDIFQVPDGMSREELIFHCAIAYGAKKDLSFFYTENLREAVKNFLDKFLSAPKVPDVKKTVEFLINQVLMNCSEDMPPDIEFALTSPLIIFALYGDQSLRSDLLNSYILPSLKKYGETEVNSIAFNFFCNLYAEIFSHSPEEVNDEVLTSFFIEGNPLVRDLAAIALLKFNLLRKKLFPNALLEWLDKNQNHPRISSIEVLLRRKVMSEEKNITLHDMLS